MTRRYFVPDLPRDGGIVSLSDEESRHASRVMRLQPDDEIELFDGAGWQSVASVAAIDKRSCTVSSMPPELVDRESGRPCSLAIAMPKGDRAKELVERLAELGVRHLVPLVCERTQRPPSAAMVTKLRRVVIESCKQSGRNILMDVAEPVGFSQFLDSLDGGPATARWVAHPGGRLLSSVCADAQSGAMVVIGPEGGLSDLEVSRARKAGFEPVGLGPRIYRIETAACLVAARLADC
ncbi:RsmE family RNA methyltransferase [Roseiconus lacunae]|uniref:RsmE family RNA methyltransferase n=1 Tax=Roseiconus lacunae TaxID=2605694 RepID=UPI001E63312B|nr:RsmE family RNA methyltransferase [Roseiconus lacunae]MCD0461715.1 16S rRNA (uracil(1498)-N(3))-methyltransferase [Roseiconus lacunae]